MLHSRRNRSYILTECLFCISWNNNGESGHCGNNSDSIIITQRHKHHLIEVKERSRSEAVIHIFLMKINSTWIEHWQFKQFMVFYLLQNIVINTFQPLLCSSCVLQRHQQHCTQQLSTVELIQDTAHQLLSTKIWPTLVTSERPEPSDFIIGITTRAVNEVASTAEPET